MRLVALGALVAGTFGAPAALGGGSDGAGSPEPAWIPTFGPLPGVDGVVSAFAVFHDGSGPALYAGGAFTTAGGLPANRIAKWDGFRWSPLGDGLDGAVSALAVFDDGSGQALYAGGSFTSAGGVAASSVARWDGKAWSALASGITGGAFAGVSALAVFDDGTGTALYAGGRFEAAGVVAASHVAKWDGSEWSALGSGIGGGLQARVGALVVHDDGTGASLFAGGSFSQAGDVAASAVARWDGSAWSALGSGISGGSFPTVSALAVFDDGGGAALYAGGNFTGAGEVAASDVARWDGTAWSPLGTGIGDWFSGSSSVYALTVLDLGGGSFLVAAGYFPSAGGVVGTKSIAAWDGSAWSGLEGTSVDSGSSPRFYALAGFDDGTGPLLHAGGLFHGGGWLSPTPQNVARWNGSQWSYLGGTDWSIAALAVFDDGTGPGLYAGGRFSIAGGVAAKGLARWVGGKASPVPISGGFWVDDLLAFDDGTGPALAIAVDGPGTCDVACYYYGAIESWNGSQLTILGSADHRVHALASFDDGTGEALYAGGAFFSIDDVQVNGIAKREGTQWVPLGSGMPGGWIWWTFWQESVLALTVFDDGTGPALYAGGDFTAAGGVPASGIAKWDGFLWSPVGGGVGGTVRSLAVHDDGTGPALYAGGDFATAGGVAASFIARWDGAHWSPLGTGLDAPVESLLAFDDGTATALVAGGSFTTAGGLPANRIARWDGAQWSPLGNGMNGAVLALAAFDDGLGGGPALVAGGDFTLALDSGDAFLAKWGFAPTLVAVPGCFRNPAALSAASDAAVLGQTLSLQLASGALPAGLALLVLGADGTGAAGCGLLLPGLGEVLLAPAPTPLAIAQAPIAGGVAAFDVPIPADPGFAGATVVLQAACLGTAPSAMVELSTGIAATLIGG